MGGGQALPLQTSKRLTSADDGHQIKVFHLQRKAKATFAHRLFSKGKGSHHYKKGTIISHSNSSGRLSIICAHSSSNCTLRSPFR